MQPNRLRRVILIFGLLAAFVLPGAGPLAAAGLHAQEAGVIAGTVISSGLVPLEGAEVAVEGTGVRVVTNNDGRFVLRGVEGDEVTLRVGLIGYRTASVQATVGSMDNRIVLQTAPVALDAVVVTGTAGATRKRSLGNSVAQVDAGDLEAAPVSSVSDMLNGRATGVVVQRGTGAVGSASEIRIRGRSSLQLNSDAPIVYVDGIRVNNRLSGRFGDPAASRIDDIDPASIESIEVIKGPAAATLYGTEASNGVIQILTKRGQDGTAQWRINLRQGINYFNNAEERIPDSYWRDPSGEVVRANLVAREAAAGRPIFRTGRHQGYGLSVSGGTADLQYYLSGGADLNEGVTPDNESERYNGMLNLAISPSESLLLRANSRVLINRLQLPRQGVTGMFPSLLWGSPSSLEDPRRGFHLAPPEVMYEAYQHEQNVNRFTTGLVAEHSPTEWLTHRMTFGVDFTDQETVYYTPRLAETGAQFFSETFAAGSKTVNREAVLYTTFDYGATASMPVTSSLTSNTSIGFQVYAKSIKMMQAEGRDFPATGVRTVAGAGLQFGRDDFLENNTVGLYLQEQVDWQDRLFLTAAIRADDNSAFGENFDLVYYPKVSGSWVVHEESFWRVDWINTFRLRAAYGESGQQPDAFAALRTFRSRSTPTGEAAVSPATVGNPDLGPERGKEIEAGFDLSLFQDRISFDFTYYDQKTTDAILRRNVAPSSGFAGQQFVNVGEISNRGIELGVQALTFDTRSAALNLGFSLNTNKNKITKLGLDEYLSLGWTTRHQEGYPVGAFFAHRVLSAELDADGNAINIMCDDGEGGSMPCLVSPRVYLGHPSPDYEGSFTSTLTLFDRLQVRGLLDFQVGQTKYVTDRWNRCAWRQVCEINVYPERFDPRAVAAVQMGGFDEFDWWIKEASFARLREVSVQYSLPDRLASWLGGSGGSVVIAGRNLGVWTRYPDLDPETMNIPNAVEEPEDQAVLPPLRQFSISVNLNYY